MAQKAIKRTTSALLSVLIAACGGGGSDGTSGSSSQSTTTAGASQGTTSTGTNAGSSNTNSGTTSSGNAGSNSGSAPNTGTSPPASPTTPSPGTASFAVDATARFNTPGDITIDNAGNLYVCDNSDQSVRRIAADGEVSTIPGGFAANPPDGTSYWGDIVGRCKLGINGSGNLVVLSEVDIFEVASTGTRTTLASYPIVPGSYMPIDIAFDPQGRLHVHLKYRNAFRVDRFEPDNNVQTVYSFLQNAIESIDIAVNAEGTLAIAIDNAYNATGQIVSAPQSALAPRPVRVHSEDESPEVVKAGTTSLPVTMHETGHMAFDKAGNLYFSDLDLKLRDGNSWTYSGMKIIKITPDGTITTLLNGLPDGSTADRVTQVPVTAMGIVAGANGDLYVTDPFNHAVYKVTQSGQATLIAGKPGEAGSSD